MSSYKVGLATCDITPPVGIYLAGFAGRNDPSTGVYHPLRATAVAIDDGATPLLVLAAEWLGFYDRAERMRRRLVEAIGLDENSILLNGSHTHCGPSVRDMDGERHGPLDQDYISRAIDRMTACATEAWAGREPATLRFGNGHCSVARCRRKPDPDNPPKVFRGMMPYNDGFVDHDVPVMAIESPEGELRGVLFSYACHPTSRGGLLIGGDYVGFALDRVEQRQPGVIAGFVQGCGADQKPRPVDPNGETFVPREVDEVREIGDELGDSVSATLESGGLDRIDGDISVRRTLLDLSTVPLDEALVRQCLDSDDWVKREWAEHHQAANQRGEPVGTVVPYELQTVLFGQSVAIVAMAAEMTVEYSLRLKRELGAHFKHVLPLGYSNHIIGYIPVKRQIPEQGYEVWDSNMIHKRTGPYVETTEQQIIDAARLGLRVAR